MHAHHYAPGLNGCHVQPHILISYVCTAVLMYASPMVVAIHQHKEASKL